MIDTTTQTNYILADTRAEVLARSPAPAGQLAVSKDTNSLFVSDGNNWAETNCSRTRLLEHSLNGNDIEHTPIHHFDANNTSQLLDTNDSSVTDGDNVSKWLSYGSNEYLTTLHHTQGTYSSDIEGTGNAGIVCPNETGYVPSDNTQSRDCGYSVFLVWTPLTEHKGLSQKNRHYYTPTDDPNYRTTNPSPIPGSTYNNNQFIYGLPEGYMSYNYVLNNNNTKQYSHTTEAMSLYHRTSNSTRYINGNNGQTYSVDLGADQHDYKVTNYPSSYDSETSTGAGVGYPNERHHHWNNHFLGKTQLYSARMENPGATRITFRAELHTYHLTYYQRKMTLANTTTLAANPTNLYRGLVLNGYPLNSGVTTHTGTNGYHEILVFDQYVSDKDYNTILNHLASKWNITRYY